MNQMPKLVTFSLDGRMFALDVFVVQRVIPVVETTPLPEAPEIVSGIINLEGQVIPVFDVRLRLNLPVREARLGDRMIIASAKKRHVALLVDSVDDVIEVPEREITAGERILPELAYVEGVVKTENGMILIHDLDRFLSLEEDKALDAAMGTASHDD